MQKASQDQPVLGDQTKGPNDIRSPISKHVSEEIGKLMKAQNEKQEKQRDPDEDNTSKRKDS